MTYGDALVHARAVLASLPVVSNGLPTSRAIEDTRWAARTLLHRGKLDPTGVITRLGLSSLKRIAYNHGLLTAHPPTDAAVARLRVDMPLFEAAVRLQR